MKEQERRLAEGILFADFYELTMAQLYYRTGIHERLVSFDYFFRSYPDYGSHKAGYCINAGLACLLDWIDSVSFGEREIGYLSSLMGRSKTPVFSRDFLAWLSRNNRFGDLTIRAIPEGRVVHPQEPVVTVQGPLLWVQLLESALLNTLNYQILIATKAARICAAAENQDVIEFGMRRAQDRAASAGGRAALIGGAGATSNTGIAAALGQAPKGTHAHSMVQMFLAMGEGELAAFRAYAQIYPDDCLLLVDTVNTLESGIPNAITVFEELRRKGHAPVGIRLDSGDLAYLAVQAAPMLDRAGFYEARIVLSNQLDEMVIWQILTQIRNEAPRYGQDPARVIRRLIFGVGTKLIVSQGAPALDGIYKLAALYDGTAWQPSLKISEAPEKTTPPGRKSLWRLYDQRNTAVADVVTLFEEDPAQWPAYHLRHPTRAETYRELAREDIARAEPLLAEVFRDGLRLALDPDMGRMRAQRAADLCRLSPGVKRILLPHNYHVSLSRELWQLKENLVQSIRS